MPSPRIIVAACAALALIFAAHASPSARAQSSINVIDEQARNDFPRGVSFSITFTGPSTVKQVRLQYRLAPDGTSATAVATCTGTATRTCTQDLVSGSSITIIPGAEITYRWDIEDADGSKFSTDDKVYVHEDTRFTFATLQQDNITVYYHSGNDAQARTVLNAAADTIERIGALERTTVPFPVKVFLYTTADEMQPAIAPGSSGRGVQVLGEVVYSDTAMVSADVDTIGIVRHELAHIVTREATKGPFGIASWMNEGTSVYSQKQPLAGHAEALASAIENDSVLSFKELNSSASGGVSATVGLYYGEAGSIITFLIDTYGANKFADLIKVFKDGSVPDKAYQAVYGLDQLGVENAWRASVGLGPRSASASPTPKATEQARAAATSSPRTPAASASSGDDGTSFVTIAIIVALAVLLLAAIALAASVIRRRTGSST